MTKWLIHLADVLRVSICTTEYSTFLQLIQSMHPRRGAAAKFPSARCRYIEGRLHVDPFYLYASNRRNNGDCDIFLTNIICSYCGHGKYRQIDLHGTKDSDNNQTGNLNCLGDLSYVRIDCDLWLNRNIFER